MGILSGPYRADVNIGHPMQVAGRICEHTFPARCFRAASVYFFHRVGQPDLGVAIVGKSVVGEISLLHRL